jgi:hypothetical protein
MTLPAESTPTAAELELWDCSTFIGRSSGRRNVGGQAVGAADLVAELDRLGVAGAMVHHVLAHEHAPAVGNAQLLRELDGHPRLLPVWVVMPSHTGELPPSGELVGQMLDAGVRMARMFPSAAMNGHRFSLAEWCSGQMLAALEEARMPLAVDFTLFRRGEPPWDDIFSVCAHHRSLPLIVIDVQGRNNRTLYPLLERFDNLYLQTAGFNVHNGLEDVTARFGAHRLLFGSGFPLLSLGGAKLQLERARLGAQDKAAIGAGNLRRLLDGVAVRNVAVRGAR